MYMIVDWANNILCYDGYFKTESLAVPMEFTDFDSAAEHLDSFDDCSDLYIETIDKGTK